MRAARSMGGVQIYAQLQSTLLCSEFIGRHTENQNLM
jgi:hypothetical protein